MEKLSYALQVGAIAGVGKERFRPAALLQPALGFFCSGYRRLMLGVGAADSGGAYGIKVYRQPMTGQDIFA